MKRFSYLVIGVFCMTVSAVLTGVVVNSWGSGAPTAQLRESIDQVLIVLRSDEVEKAHRIAELIRPRFDFEKMAQLTLHRHWRAQSQEDRERFLELFPKLLEKTYITKLSLYSSPKVEYVREYQRGDKAQVQTRVTVKSTTIQVGYRMHRKGAEWRIYDVNIEGVSLVRNYRTQLASILKRESFAALLAKIEGKIMVASAD